MKNTELDPMAVAARDIADLVEHEMKSITAHAQAMTKLLRGQICTPPDTNGLGTPPFLVGRVQLVGTRLWAIGPTITKKGHVHARNEERAHLGGKGLTFTAPPPEMVLPAWVTAP